MFQRLLEQLYLALNRDPQPAPGFHLAVTGPNPPSSYWIDIEDDHLRGTAQEQQAAPAGPIDPTAVALAVPNLDIDLLDIGGTGAKTLSDLVAYLNTFSDFTATLDAGVDGTVWAVALCDSSKDILSSSAVAGFSDTTALPLYGSLLWALLKPVAWLLRRAQAERSAGFRDSTPQRAAGLWLNSLGDLYGVRRLLGESDDRYRARIYYTVIKPRTNNVAMEDILRYSFDFQNVTVSDSPGTGPWDIDSNTGGDYKFDVVVDLDDSGLAVSVIDLHATVQAIKAWGTVWDLLLRSTYHDHVDFKELALYGLSFKMTPEQADLPDVDLVTGELVQYFRDSARVPSPYIVASVWHHYGSNTHWLSEISNPGSAVYGGHSTYLSWASLWHETWRDDRVNNRSNTDQWGHTFTEFSTLALSAAPEQVNRPRSDATSGQLIQAWTPEGRVRYPFLFASSSLHGASVWQDQASPPRPTGRWARTMGDTSYYIRH